MFNGLDCHIGFDLEYPADIDLSAYFVADLVADGLDQVFHFGLILVLVNVSRDRPYQFQPVQQRRQSLLDHRQVSPRYVLELPLQSRQELHEVLSLSVHFREVLPLRLEVLHRKRVWVLTFIRLQNLKERLTLLLLLHKDILTLMIFLT